MADRIVQSVLQEICATTGAEPSSVADLLKTSVLITLADNLLTVLKSKFPDEIRECLAQCALAQGIGAETLIESHRIVWALGFYYGATDGLPGEEEKQ